MSEYCFLSSKNKQFSLYKLQPLFFFSSQHFSFALTMRQVRRSEAKTLLPSSFWLVASKKKSGKVTKKKGNRKKHKEIFRYILRSGKAGLQQNSFWSSKTQKGAREANRVKDFIFLPTCIIKIFKRKQKQGSKHAF